MKHALNITTTLILCGSMAQAYAQSPAACIPTPSCTSLGYTSTTSCTDGLKCPFGNYWNCNLNKITELTNKITELEKTIEKIEKENALRSCAVGHIFNSDKTCSTSVQSDKTPIGVVVYTDGAGHGQVIGLNSIGKLQWSSSDTSDVPTLTNFDNEDDAIYDLNSCLNTEKIIAYGNKSQYPAAWAAHEYKTEGTNAGDWCLPAAGIFSLYYNNRQIINIAITSAGGIQTTTNTLVWSSTERYSNSAWNAYFGNFENLEGRYKDYAYEVLPVLEF